MSAWQEPRQARRGRAPSAWQEPRQARRRRAPSAWRPSAVVLLLTALALSACAARQPVRALDDGVFQVDCPGGYHDWSKCHTAAAARCDPSEYRVISQTSNEGGAVGRGDWSQQGSEVARTMEFRCVP